MKYWYQKQLRMVQTVLREPDIVDYDAKAVVQYLKDSDANNIIVNAGGIVDFFHSGLEGANLNPFMTKEDILKDLVREAHAAGITVICRIDFRGAEKDFYRAHPDWFARDEKGGPKMMSAIIKSEVDIYQPCYNSRYMNEHAMEFLDSLFTQYDIDGIWENAVGAVNGVCYCERCQKKYREDNGRNLPSAAEMKDPLVYEQYRQWKYKCAEEHIQRLRNTVKKYGEDKAYAAEVWGFLKRASREQVQVVDLQMGQKNFDFFVTPAMVSQDGAPGNYPSGLAYPASIVKYMHMISKDKQSVLLFGNNGGTLRYVRDPMAENKIWLWESVSAGSGFWNCLFNGQHPAATNDTRAAYISKPAYRFLKENEELLETNAPLAEVAIYASKASVDVMGGQLNEDGGADPKADRVLMSMKGVEKILTEKHLQFVHLPSVGITLDALQQYRAVILPNSACLSDNEVELFKEYVAGGGNLIATFETSLYDENGKKREDFALGEVFGVSATGMVIDTSVDCYQLIRQYDSPLIKGISDTEVLANCEQTHLVNIKSGAQAATTYIPIIRNQPPEKAWIRDKKTAYPVAVLNRYGKGTVVYFACQIDRALHTYAHDDFVQLYSNALDIVVEKPMIETNAPASVHIQTIAVQEGNGKMMLSLVNHTGTMYRPVQQVVPVHDLYVTVRMPGTQIKESKILYQEHPVQIESAIQKGTVEVTVKLDRLDEFTSLYLNVQ